MAFASFGGHGRLSTALPSRGNTPPYISYPSFLATVPLQDLKRGKNLDSEYANPSTGRRCTRVPRVSEPRLSTETPCGNAPDYLRNTFTISTMEALTSRPDCVWRFNVIPCPPVLSVRNTPSSRRTWTPKTPVLTETVAGDCFARNIFPPFVAITLTGTSGKCRHAFRLAAGNPEYINNQKKGNLWVTYGK